MKNTPQSHYKIYVRGMDPSEKSETPTSILSEAFCSETPYSLQANGGNNFAVVSTK
jgi:hypothetical protein